MIHSSHMTQIFFLIIMLLDCLFLVHFLSDCKRERVLCSLFHVSFQISSENKLLCPQNNEVFILLRCGGVTSSLHGRLKGIIAVLISLLQTSQHRQKIQINYGNEN